MNMLPVTFRLRVPVQIKETRYLNTFRHFYDAGVIYMYERTVNNGKPLHPTYEFG